MPFRHLLRHIDGKTAAFLTRSPGTEMIRDKLSVFRQRQTGHFRTEEFVKANRSVLAQRVIEPDCRTVTVPQIFLQM